MTRPPAAPPSDLLWSAGAFPEDAERRSPNGTAPDRPQRVAIIHDWLVTFAGAEQVLKELLTLYPHAEIFTLVDFMPTELRQFLGKRRIHTSFLQHFPNASKWYRHYLPLMPLAVEQFDLQGFDLVVSSSHAVAKGVLTGPDQIHVCYCHSPIRYAWDLQHQYLRESGLTHGPKAWLARWILHKIRVWDSRTAHGVDGFIANSKFIARRVAKAYGRTSRVIHPPVRVETFTPGVGRKDFYLTASRFVPYKRIPLIVEAFSGMPDKSLVVIGDGPERDRVLAKAGPNVTVLGHEPLEVLRTHMQQAKAFVFAAEEDFGITPVEAQACGTPVIALGRGGSTETVLNGRTGILFEEQTVESIQAAVDRFEARESGFDPRVVRAHANGFGASRFRAEFDAAVREITAEAPLRNIASESVKSDPDLYGTLGNLGGGEIESVVVRHGPVSKESSEHAADDIAVAIAGPENIAPFPVVPEFLSNPQQRRSS